MTAYYHLKSMPAAQCYVRFTADEHGAPMCIELYSYNTCILVVSRCLGDAWACYPVFNPAYSRTTARHVNRFTTELYGVNMYYECKAVYNAEQDCLPSLLSSREVHDFWNYYAQHGKKFSY